eukprot:6149606-Prymnesium_polylepis.2
MSPRGTIAGCSAVCAVLGNTRRTGMQLRLGSETVPTMDKLAGRSVMTDTAPPSNPTVSVGDVALVTSALSGEPTPPILFVTVRKKRSAALDGMSADARVMASDDAGAPESSELIAESACASTTSTAQLPERRRWSNSPCRRRLSQTERVDGADSTAVGSKGFSGSVTVKEPLAQTCVPSGAVQEPSASG